MENLLAFVYDPDKLHGMPEKNFVLLRANEKQQLYETVRLDRPDDNTYTVTASIREEGVYTLVDAYALFSYLPKINENSLSLYSRLIFSLIHTSS